MPIHHYRRPLIGATIIAAVASLAACGSTNPTATTTTKPAVTSTAKVPTSTGSSATTAKPTATTATAPTTAKPATTTAKPAATTAPVVKVNVNTATDAELTKIPGMTTTIIATIKQGRPYASIDAFRTALTKTLTVAQVTALEKYLSF